MRLIDVDKIPGAFMITAIAEAPTVDAVPVIHCYECKYFFGDGYDECTLMRANSIIAGINNKRWYSDFYCAWAERKEKDGE